jgi:hypothetical protein
MVGANAARFPARRMCPPKADLTNEEAMATIDRECRGIEETES